MKEEGVDDRLYDYEDELRVADEFVVRTETGVEEMRSEIWSAIFDANDELNLSPQEIAFALGVVQYELVDMHTGASKSDKIED